MSINNLVVFDFETTGLNAKQDAIIEIAAISIENGKIIEEFSQLINPKRHLPKIITNITGLTDEDLEDQPQIVNVLPKFLNFIDNKTIVAHNAAFDLSFLLAACERLKMTTAIQNPFVDTRSMCIKHYPYQSHKLDVMCQQLNIEFEGAHRALNDVIATYELLKKLDETFGTTEKFINKIYHYKKYPTPTGLPEYAELVPV